MRLLLVEDDQNLRTSLLSFLQSEAFTVSTAESFKQAQTFAANEFDLIILDWALPDGQGIDLLKAWRQKSIKTKVIFLTARADIFDRVLGLELGAQDYLTKPFDPRELLARIRVQLRELNQTYNSLLSSQDLEVDTNLREVKFEGKTVNLTKMEFELLVFLLKQPNKPFSREELLNSVWGYEQYPSTRTVDNHILQLRQKISSEFFETIHGVGYRFVENKK